MNTVSFMVPTTPTNNSVKAFVESWFVPIDIIRIIFTTSAIVMATGSLCTIILNKKYHRITIIFAADSFLTALIFGSDMLGMAIFTLENDLKQIQIPDAFCSFRFYMGVASCTAFNFSFLLQAMYRYFIVVYPRWFIWQSGRFQFLLIILTWIFSYIWPIPLLIMNEVIYNPNNQICQLFLRLSFSIIYMTCCAYAIPMLIVMYIYFILVRYVRDMSTHVSSTNVVVRAQKHLTMVRRIVIIIALLVILGLPYTSFIVMSFFTAPPKYHFRIAFIFIDISLACVILILFKFTKGLKLSIINRIRKASNFAIATIE